MNVSHKEKLLFGTDTIFRVTMWTENNWSWH